MSQCDLPSVRGELVDALVWEWAKTIIANPNNLRVGLDNVQKELDLANQPLLDRLSIVEKEMEPRVREVVLEGS